MNATTALFYLFSLVLLASGFMVITARNTVHSALWLVLTFFNASCLWMLLHAEFLAIVLVLVYVGAVMVLFLFVVMMLDLHPQQLRAAFWKHFPLAGLVGVLIALEMVLVMRAGFTLSGAAPMPADLVAMGNSKALGVVLYTQYLFPVQIAAMLLLVAMVAAVALTLRGRKDSHSQNPGEQVRVKASDRLRMVKMAPTVEVPAQPPEPAAPVSNKPGSAA